MKRRIAKLMMVGGELRCKWYLDTYAFYYTKGCTDYHMFCHSQLRSFRESQPLNRGALI